MTKTMKLERIAEKIHEHLKRMEADKEINQRSDGHVVYYHANSWASGNRVFVKSICYQHGKSLKKEEALGYLEWLDAGNNGTVYRYLNEVDRGRVVQEDS